VTAVVNRDRKLIAVTAIVALLAGGGAAVAAMKLASSPHAAAPDAPAALRVGVGGYGLGGRLRGRGFGGGVGAGTPAPGPRGFGLGFFSGQALAPLAAYLGLSSSDLQSNLADGQTLAQIAKAQGKSAEGVVSTLVGVRERSLEQAVSAGRITAAQAKELLARERLRIRDFVNGPQSPDAGSPGAATA
jgi:hypothetical protein